MIVKIIRWTLGVLILILPILLVLAWAGAAEDRLSEASSLAVNADAPQVAVASAADEEYCTPQLKQILRRVLTSCGLVGATGGRGCRPLEVRNVATMSGEDFNALFIPMQERGGIIQFERASAELDAQDLALVDRIFSGRRGASYFFVVSRASPDGTVDRNRELSRQRAEAVLSHLEDTFHDPELERQVGLLWLGEEFAQLDPRFCSWPRSGPEENCEPTELNRSAFIAWIDCQI